MTDTSMIDNTTTPITDTPATVDVSTTTDVATTPSTSETDVVSTTTTVDGGSTLIDGVTLAAVPAAMMNGTLTSADSSFVSLKAQLDADILAAQSRAKTTATLVVATAKAAIADVEAWIGSAPGQMLVVPPTQQASTFTSEVSSIGNTLLNDSKSVSTSLANDWTALSTGAKNELNVLESDAKSVWNKVASWWKNL